MKLLRFAILALASGAMLTFLGLNALLWGMNYGAGPFRHAVGLMGAALLYPGAFTSGTKMFGADSIAWAIVVFVTLLWHERKKASKDRAIAI